MTPVNFITEGSVGIIILDRPEVHNAVNTAVMEALEGILDQIDRRDDLRALILTGAGQRSFCAGADLKHFANLTRREDGGAMSRRMSAVLRRLADGPRPVIAAINGDALGGGCEVLLACHLRMATANAHFSFRQAAMGVVTGWGGGTRAFRLLGRGHALRLLLTADTIDAAEARRIGLVDFVARDGDLLIDEATALARRVAANAPESIAAFLELAQTWESAGAAATEQREAELFEERWVGEHFRQKVAAWADRKNLHRDEP